MLCDIQVIFQSVLLLSPCVSFFWVLSLVASCGCVRIKLEAHRLLSALPQLVLSYVQLFLYFLELFITIPCYLKSKDFSLLLQ